MNSFFKKVLIVSFSLSVLHFPLLFAKSETAHVVCTPSESISHSSEYYNSVYQSAGLGALGLPIKAFKAAMKGFEKLRNSGRVANDHIITIADFTTSSAKKRLYVIDLDQQKILYNTYVAHGQGSGAEYARRFSNTPESLQSSPGFYLTTTTYTGKHGYSLKLNGLEPGINDQAVNRAIVMHGADYVSSQYIRKHGYLGRSWGCPAIPQKLRTPIINTIRNGSVLFIYCENSNYLRKSKMLNS